jgi:uncharacterized protein (DUF1501 family)
MLSRRELLKRLGVGSLAAGFPGVMFANAQTDNRLVVVILRGAMDGMAMLAPYGDGNYAGLRGKLALAAPGREGGVLKVDGLFGIHPALKHTNELFQQKQALFVHAVASGYRERSHFDGQDQLESGSGAGNFRRDGWLNRALQPLAGQQGNESAIAISQNTPLLLRGNQPVTSWAPSKMPDAAEDTLSRLESLYANDPFFSSRLQQALDSQEIAGEMSGSKRGRVNKQKQMEELMKATAKFLSAPKGPRIAVLESGGWDTHARQGAATGSLAGKFVNLDKGISVLQQNLGDAWANTVVMVVTEFGRTAKANGTGGTDHGTATAAMLVGGAVNGGRVVADWPGLSTSNLYEGRDLYPTTDIRSVFKGVLAEHLKLQESFLDQSVFPNKKPLPMIEGLVIT